MKITSEEFLEKYGNVKVAFQSYYKYIFTFTGTTQEGYDISVSAGGSEESIYIFAVESDSHYQIRDLSPYCGEVKDREGRTIEDFFDL